MRPTFVINPDSGGRLGRHLARRLAARGEPVHDLRRGGLERLAAAAAGPLVACGGDGTAAAVIEAVHRTGRDLPVAVLPLGTGNDLARHLGWPAAPPRAGELDAWLAHAIAAPEVRLDRWVLAGPGLFRAWFNYWSLGADAGAALRFHHLRRIEPWLARGGAVNRALYGICGLGAGTGLAGAVEGPLPPGTAALVLAGIPSYAGGRRLGPGIRADDGRLDLFALPGGLSLGLVLGGRRRARPLGRHPAFAIRLRRPLPMQLDGEPFLAPAGEWMVRHGGQVRVLAGPRAFGA